MAARGSLPPAVIVTGAGPAGAAARWERSGAGRAPPPAALPCSRCRAASGRKFPSAVPRAASGPLPPAAICWAAAMRGRRCRAAPGPGGAIPGAGAGGPEGAKRRSRRWLRRGSCALPARGGWSRNPRRAMWGKQQQEGAGGASGSAAGLGRSRARPLEILAAPSRPSNPAWG